MSNGNEETNTETDAIQAQAITKVYREDTLFQLKLELDTSLETGGKFTFTKDVLNLKDYKGRALDSYPYFAPYKVYRKGKIQRMTYLERVELFFNRQRFEQVIFGRKSRTKKKIAKRKKYERNESLEDLKEKNFIFTIKMLFSTAFPIVDNFSKSSEYFSNDITRNITFKGTNLEFFPFLSGKFDKKFSHLKINNEIYTITKVIWVNDVFNHPLYNRIVDNYRKIKDDQAALEIRKQGYDSRKNDLINNLFTDNPKFDEALNGIKSYTETFAKEKDGNRGRLTDTQGFILTAQNTLEKFKTTRENNSNDNEKWKAIGNIIPSIEQVLNLRESIISVESKEFFRSIFTNYKQIRINLLAIDYINRFEFRFPGAEEKDKREIRRIISQIFPKANEFSEQLNEFAKERNIGNKDWNLLVQSRKLDESVRNAFDQLAKCYTNENCNVQSENAYKYIEVELDEITKRPQDAKIEMYEAFLQVNIIEGEVTTKNYSKIKCKYLDEELDNFLDNIINPQDDWNIQNEKNFFSVKSVVEKANEEIKTEKTIQKKKSQENQINTLNTISSTMNYLNPLGTATAKRKKKKKNPSKNKKKSKRNTKKNKPTTNPIPS